MGGSSLPRKPGQSSIRQEVLPTPCTGWGLAKGLASIATSELRARALKLRVQGFHLRTLKNLGCQSGQCLERLT